MKVNQYKTLLGYDGLPKLVKEKSSNYSCEELVNPELIVDMMMSVFKIHKQTEEFVYEVCFTSRMKPIGVFEISHGCINMSVGNPREIFQKALMCGAANFAIVHNHPSGNCEPSKNDRQNAETLKGLGEMMGVNLMDSIIVGDRNYYSFKEKEW